MKKVLLVSGSLPPIRCGVGYYSQKLSSELAKRKVDFEILSTEGVDENTPAPLRSVPNWRVTSLPKILSEIRASRAEIIHIQYPAKGYRRQLGINLLPYLLRVLRPRLKILITLHEFHQSRILGRIRNFITIIPAHRVFVSNQPDKNMLKYFGAKVSVVPIGANFDVAAKDPKFVEETLKGQGLDPSVSTIIFFGYAFRSKRLELLLEALNEPELANSQLLLMGSFGEGEEDNYQRMLKKKIEDINHNINRVGITGFLEGNEVSAIMQAGRYFVIPNNKPISAKSGTAIAAIQNGMIVISLGSRDSAPFEHEKNCFLLDKVTPQSIALAIDRLEKTPAERQRISRGIKKLQKYFSWDEIAKKHTSIYEEL